MKVNESVYGSKDSWLNIYPDTSPSYTYNSHSGFKVANFGGDSYPWRISTGKQNSRLPSGVNEFDKSITIFGVGKDSAFAHMVGLYPVSQGDNYILEVQKSYNQMPLLMTTNGDGGQLFPYYTNYNYKLSNSADYYKFGFVTEFDYQSVIGVCYLIVTTNAFLTGGNYNIKILTVDEYYSTTNGDNWFTQYPIVLQGGMRFYTYDTAANITRTNGQLNSAYINGYRPFIDLSSYGDQTQYNTDYMRLYGGSFRNSIPVLDLLVFGNLDYDAGIVQASIGATPSDSFNISSSTQYNTALLLAMVDDEAKLFQQKVPGYSDRYNVLAYWEAPSKSDILRKFAFVGFWFTDKDDSDTINAKTGVECDNPNVYLPVFKAGITTGEYKAGVETRDLENAKWNSVKDVQYNPDNDDETRDENDDNPTGRYRFDNSHPANSYYILTYSALREMLTKINSTINYGETGAADWYGIDPADFILSCYVYPNAFYTFGTKPLTIGRVNVLDAELPIITTSLYKLDIGSIFVEPYYNDFRDFAPYSTYTLYIPFLATLELDPMIFLNHELSVEIAIDITTHTAEIIIIRDQFPYQKITTPYGVSVGITAYAVGTYQNTIANMRFGQFESLMKAVGSTVGTVTLTTGAVASGAGIGAVAPILLNGASTVTNDIMSIAKTEYNIDHTSPKPIAATNSGGASNRYGDTIARLIITHCKSTVDDNAFLTLKGGQTCEAGLIGSYHGYTEATEILFDDTSGITSNEISMISRLFTEGVILP